MHQQKLGPVNTSGLSVLPFSSSHVNEFFPLLTK